MMEMLLQSIEDSAQKGFKGFRTAGDIHGRCAGGTCATRLLGYERYGGEMLPGQYRDGDMPVSGRRLSRKKCWTMYYARTVPSGCEPNKPIAACRSDTGIAR